jgi:hypothetical protein
MAIPVFKWTSRRPRPAGTCCLRRSGDPTEFSDSDLCGPPRARALVPGWDKHFYFPYSVAIPNGKIGPAHQPHIYSPN